MAIRRLLKDLPISGHRRNFYTLLEACEQSYLLLEFSLSLESSRASLDTPLMLLVFILDFLTGVGDKNTLFSTSLKHHQRHIHGHLWLANMMVLVLSKSTYTKLRYGRKTNKAK